MFDLGVERTVSVWGKPHKVTVYPKSKSVWIATGNYMGQSVEGKGSTERAALRAWHDAACSRGNDGPVEK